MHLLRCVGDMCWWVRFISLTRWYSLIITFIKMSYDHHDRSDKMIVNWDSHKIQSLIICFSSTSNNGYVRVMKCRVTWSLSSMLINAVGTQITHEPIRSSGVRAMISPHHRFHTCWYEIVGSYDRSFTSFLTNSPLYKYRSAPIQRLVDKAINNRNIGMNPNDMIYWMRWAREYWKIWYGYECVNTECRILSPTNTNLMRLRNKLFNWYLASMCAICLQLWCVS